MMLRYQGVKLVDTVSIQIYEIAWNAMFCIIQYRILGNLTSFKNITENGLNACIMMIMCKTNAENTQYNKQEVSQTAASSQQLFLQDLCIQFLYMSWVFSHSFEATFDSDNLSCKLKRMQCMQSNHLVYFKQVAMSASS